MVDSMEGVVGEVRGLTMVELERLDNDDGNDDL